MYEDKILVLVDGLEIDVSANDAEWLVTSDSEDYLMVDNRIYQRPRKTNPFNHPPKAIAGDKQIYDWWHQNQH